MMRRILGRAASSFDDAVSAAVLSSSRKARARSRVESMGHEDRVRALRHIASLYEPPEHWTSPDSFFRPPPTPAARLSRVRSLAGGEVMDAVWPSAYEPYCAEVTERYGRAAPNRTAAARLFLHGDAPRPVAILIHGYRCGQYALEERAWPVSWLFERGLDVAIAVLPFHAVRGARGGPGFPSNDPRITVEGFRQAMHDLRSLAALLRARGAPAVGAMGMSLGGYSASLLATVDPDLAFVVPIIPLASIADVARGGGRYVGSAAEQLEQHTALEAAHSVVSPLARPSRISSERALVVGAESDRITPLDHARRIAAHLGAPLEVIHGGHLLQFGRGDAFRAVGRMLGRLGLLAPR